MKLKKRHMLCGLVLCLSMAFSGMGLGYALWHTDLSAAGGVVASGNWDVQITDARISQLSGAALEGSDADAEPAFQPVSAETQIAELVAAQSSGTIGSAASGETLGEGFYVIDTDVYSVSDMTALARDAIQADGSSLDLSGQPRYCRSDETGATDDTLVTQALLEDTYEMLVAANPAEASYDHFALVYLAEDPGQNLLLATVQAQDTSTAVVDDVTSFTGTSVNFAPVNFNAPGAWAEYTLTVTNNGTVDAKLDTDALFQLDTASDQLELATPDLSQDTLAPGQSCTYTFTVQAKADVSALEDTGTLSVSLSYSQPEIAPIPAPSYSLEG